MPHLVDEDDDRQNENEGGKREEDRQIEEGQLQLL
jgi:hypothetical protein